MDAKRQLTESVRESTQAANHVAPSSTPADLVLQLRSVGARVRRNVSQGYINPPSHYSAFSRTTSSDSIFRSANDTLRDVFNSQPPATTPLDQPRKRSHTPSDQDLTDVAPPKDQDNDQEIHRDDTQSNASNRPVRPLRKPRKAVTDSVLLFQRPSTSSEPVPATTTIEEEDWSISESSQQFQTVTFP